MHGSFDSYYFTLRNFSLWQGLQSGGPVLALYNQLTRLELVSCLETPLQ